MPQPDHDVRDPRIKRTRQLLRDSLRTLLKQKPFEAILVQEITQAAEVNRATFYDHFSDKLELFNSMVAADFERFLEERQVCFDGGCPEALGAIVLAVGDFLEQMHRDGAACSSQAGSGPVIDAAITLAVKRVILAGLDEQRLPTLAPRDVAAAMLAASIYAGVKETMASREWRVDANQLLALLPALKL